MCSSLLNKFLFSSINILDGAVVVEYNNDGGGGSTGVRRDEKHRNVHHFNELFRKEVILK